MQLVDNQLLKNMAIQTGENLQELSSKKPILLVFLRHFGCQFCRETMDDLSKQRTQLKEKNIELVLVHMAENKIAEEYFKKFNLTGVKHVSDPTCHFYSGFGLVKGSFTQLFGLQSWFRGFTVQAKYGAEVGKHLGDSFQMPGAFMVFEGEVKESYIHKSASDRPDYTKLVSCCNFSELSKKGEEVKLEG